MSEVEELRARVAELEQQLAEQARATNAIVARSQQELYWLERWHVDINALMQHRAPHLALGVLKGAREAIRFAKKTRRKLAER